MPRKLNLITGEIMKKIISFILGSIFALNLAITAANSAANVVRVAYFLEWPSPNLEDMQKKNFAKALGADENEIEKVKLDWFTKDMIDNFFSQARKSYAEGLASLYTYERQIPEIAETKIQGLKKFYGVKSKEGLEFFEAHKSADVIHRAECEKLLDSLTKEEQEKAESASLLTARYLWNFLSGMTTKHKLQTIAA